MGSKNTIAPEPRLDLRSATMPRRAWVTHQARNLSGDLIAEGTTPRFLIRDRDKKFTRSFDEVFGADGARIILTPIRAPQRERPRRTMGGHRALGVPGLDPHPRSAASRTSLTDLRR